MSKPVSYAALNIRIHNDTKKRLEAYSAAKGQSQGSIVDAALREYLDDSSNATLILRELGRLRRGVGRVERNLDVIDAGIAGFVQMWLAYNPPLPGGQKEAAKAMAAERFEQFITFIQHQIKQHKTFIAQVAEDDLLRNEDIRALLDMEGEGKA
jgi:predicted DNA-binding protein